MQKRHERGKIGNSQGTDHFETKRAIDHEENQVDDLAYVDHGIEVIVALDKGQSSLLPPNDRDRAFRVLHSLLRIPTNEALEEGGLPDPGGSHNGDKDGRRCVVGGPVDQGNMQASLVALYISAALSVGPSARLGCKSLGASQVGDGRSTDDAPFR